MLDKYPVTANFFCFLQDSAAIVTRYPAYFSVIVAVFRTNFGRLQREDSQPTATWSSESK